MVAATVSKIYLTRRKQLDIVRCCCMCGKKLKFNRRRRENPLTSGSWMVVMQSSRVVVVDISLDGRRE
jgi:hypothetical protein